jgi:hypothetical protein
MPWMQQMVLQRAWQCFIFTHRKSLGPCQAQGSSVTPSVYPGRYCSGVLQLWNQECLPLRIHSCKIRHSRGSSLQTAVRFDTFVQRYELGYISLAAPD